MLPSTPEAISEEVAVAGKISLDQLAQMYINSRKVEGTSIRTLNEIKSFLKRHLIPVFAQRPVEEIKYDEIVKIVAKAYEKRSPVTRGRYLSYLKTVFKFGVEHDLIEKNPLRQWHKPREKPRDTKLTVDDLQKIKAEAEPHLAWAIEVAWNLGVRTGPSELLALTWDDINWADKTINVFATKTNTRRTVPLSDEFLARLKEKKASAQCDRVVEYNGRPVKQISRAMRTACRRTGITYPVVLYDVRHLFATSLLNEGGDLSAVSKLMDHSSIQMTANNYYHLLGNEKRRTIARLPRLE
ncbi:tyrosine-type recombinase/integrase [Solidesulfovibrio aerotolerans]|uniref:tyrosine-type recombinase/integrase n=1 Tax=Solidesulfovibrio aerotolerans TaxID=295255 RepID=UPI0031B5D9B8